LTPFSVILDVYQFVFDDISTIGLVLPLVLPSVIRSHGTAITLRVLSCVILGLLVVVIPFLKPRLPKARQIGPGVRGRRSDWMREATWWSFVAANTFHGIIISLISFFTFDYHAYVKCFYLIS